ncbi:hypothetical protein ACPV4B_02995 [Vibrio parahaemolyticus]|uniref:hypothetical protein n=1 Tax=Vibrio mediterranei TaxID=689 RepID=UPI004068BA8B
MLTLQREGIEDPKLWANTFYTTVDHIALFVDLPAQSLKRIDRLKQARIQTRLLEVHAILRRVQPWFSSEQAAWSWFIGEPIASFGRLTPSEIIKQYKSDGVEAINDYITAKEMGAFE